MSHHGLSRFRPRLLGALSIAAAAVVLTLSAPLTAQQLPAGVTRGASVEGITEYTLANGFRVLLFPDQSKPTVTVNITYLVGSRHEGYGETGMAHLLEHLLFKGTPRHPNIMQELTEHGAFPNGTTWYDRTNYFETLPATDVNLEWALDLEADRMVNSYIAKKDLESEFTVVRNEFESGENSAFRVTMQRTMATAFEWHNYGKTTIGARSDIENVPIERLQAFYRRYYQPDNSLLTVAGKFDMTRTLALINAKFGAIPRPERSLERGNLLYETYTRDPEQDGEREVTIRRVGDEQMVMALYKVPAGTHADFAAVQVLARIMTQTPGGRLHKALIEPQLAASTQGNAFQLREPGAVLGMASLRREQSLDAARTALIGAMEGFEATPPTAAEMAQAKTAMAKEIELQFANSQSVALSISEWASMGDWRMQFIHRDRVEKVTLDDVKRVATTYFKTDNRTIGLFVPTEKPDRVKIPAVAASDVANLVKDYRGRAALTEGEAFDPSPSNLDARTVRATLPGGMKVAMLEKKTRGNIVNARVTLRFGSEHSLTGRVDASRLVGSMLDKGTKNKTRQQIKEEFDRLKAQVNFLSSGNAVIALVQTTRENLMPTLALVAEVLREPVFDAKEFGEIKRAQLQGLEAQKSEPTMLAVTLFGQKMGPYPADHPLATKSMDGQVAALEALTVDAVRNIYTEFVGATYSDFAISGDFDPAAVTAWARATFDGWKSPQPFARLERKYFDVPQFNETIETPDKASAFFFAGQNLRLSDASPDYAALTIGNFVLGGGFLNSRLAVRIRQKDGISYGVGSGLGAASLDEVGSFSANAIYAPENVLRLESAFGEEMGRLLKEGITTEELEAAKSAWLQQREQQRANDGQITSMFSNQAMTGRTMAFEAELDDRVRRLTAAQVNTALAKHLSLSKISSVKAGDFKNKPPTPLKTTP